MLLSVYDIQSVISWYGTDLADSNNLVLEILADSSWQDTTSNPVPTNHRPGNLRQPITLPWIY